MVEAGEPQLFGLKEPQEPAKSHIPVDLLSVTDSRHEVVSPKLMSRVLESRPPARDEGSHVFALALEISELPLIVRLAGQGDRFATLLCREPDNRRGDHSPGVIERVLETLEQSFDGARVWRHGHYHMIAAMPTPRRGYSRAFTPGGSGHARYLLDKIPGPLWRHARAKALRQGLSMRALILHWLSEWLRGERRV
jgi:hypothetical protein